LPVFRSDKAFRIARRVKALLNPRRNAASKAERRKERASNRKRAQRLRSEHKKKLRSEIKSKKQQLSQTKRDFRSAEERAARIECKRRKKTLQQELYELERELRAAQKGRAMSAPAAQSAPRVAGEPGMGVLPDFVVIGGKKCGTSFFYHLLSQHPYVEPAAAKELHFFDRHFDEGLEWYRRCFPQPRWEDGRRTITGEATPGYMRSSLAPVRMARVVPQARLIALLRNPVDRAYSDYQMVLRKERETRSFEKAVGAEEATIEAKVGKWRARRIGGEDETSKHEEDGGGPDDSPRQYLFKGLYVYQLVRWSKFFDKEQMLVLKSEDFFKRPEEILKAVYAFLGLPEWEPEAPEPRDERKKEKHARTKRNKGRYEQEMDPATRRRLEEYFEPHNRRLYEYLGVDFGW
jgi:hypothetical protein